MKDLSALLTTALAHYRELLHSYRELDRGGFGSDAKALERFLARMTGQMERVRQADLEVAEALAATGADSVSQALLQEYRDLLAQVAASNRTMLERARVHHALVQDELSEIRSGKSALAGYRLNAGATGDSLNQKF